MNDEEYPQNYSTNANEMSVDAYTTETALRIRLDTSPLKYQIQMFLEGKHEAIERNTYGQLVTVQRPKGEPLANKIGVQRIMSYLESVINSQVVQGNFALDRYEWFMERTRKELARHLFVNMYSYGITQEEYPLIVDMICSMIELFVSRVINDLERKSYAGWMIHHENTQAHGQEKKGLWSRLGIGK